VRHAEPVFAHGPRRFVGQLDPPLSSAGVEQAQRLAEQLRTVGFDSVYSSDLQRCLQTAHLVAEQAVPPTGRASVPVTTDQRLREIDCGLWEGLTTEEAAARCPIEYSERERDIVGYPFPAGESFLDLRARVLPALWQILDEGAARVLVVSHLGVARALMCEFGGIPFTDIFSFKLEHAGIMLLRVTATAGGARRIEVVRKP
jgi:alpha-ribazole phosphatase